jgi:acetyltransferase-like isoleucine patch superfamily enzyme
MKSDTATLSPTPAFMRWLCRRKGTPFEQAAGWSNADGILLFLRILYRLQRGVWLRLKAPGISFPTLCATGVRIYHAKGLTAGPHLNLEEGCEIVALASNGIRLGKNCTIGRFASIRPTNVLMGPVGEGLQMGDHSNIGPYSYIGCSGKVTIGSNVLMGQRVSIQAENHLFHDMSKPIREQGVKRSAVTIGDNCWIGSGVTITAGLSIGPGTVIGAGAVVTRDLPANVVATGVPARIMRHRDEHPH